MSRPVVPSRNPVSMFPSPRRRAHSPHLCRSCALSSFMTSGAYGRNHQKYDVAIGQMTKLTFPCVDSTVMKSSPPHLPVHEPLADPLVPLRILLHLAQSQGALPRQRRVRHTLQPAAPPGCSGAS